MHDQIHVIPGSIDSHCHLSHIRDKGVDPGPLLRSVHEMGMHAVLDVGLSPGDLNGRLAEFSAIPGVYFTSGIHPSRVEQLVAESLVEESIELLKRQLSSGKVVAVGETGLDYHWDTGERSDAVRLFESQVKLARAYGLPVIVHNRDADEDVFRVLAEHGPRGVMHCFSSSTAFCERCLEIGMHISLAGNVTFKRSDELRTVARLIPRERLLVETDAPYMSPEPLRGRTNHPGHLGYTIRTVADVRGETENEVARASAQNAMELFGIS